jgi:ABC-type uncharacterized transport system auxiliary subunit
LEFTGQKETLIVKEPIVNSSCEILPVSIPPAFAQSRIAVRKRSHEISYYQNHQWAVPPGDLLTKLVERLLQEEHIFINASQTVWEIVPQYQVHSQIYQLEAVDRGDNLYAHLYMQIYLFNRSENGIIVTHEFERLELLEERDINLLAKSFSEILKEELQKFSQKMKVYFSKN